MKTVTISTGARLHFGLVVRGEPGRRRYGGVGLMIDQPGFVLSVRAAEADHITASPFTTERIQQFLSNLRQLDGEPHWEIVVHEEIPAHAGLGSGTQLGLALASGIDRLRDDEDCSVMELARRLQRGVRSSIGTLGFQSGALITDGGKPAGSDFAVPTGRHEFPVDWRIVLITPQDDEGLSGEREKQFFNESPAMTAVELSDYCLLICTKLLPALADADFSAFSAAVSRFGQQVGQYFSSHQGGVIANPRMAALAEKLRVAGIEGVGQTSWGPTLFALCPNAAIGQSVAADISKSAQWADCRVRVVSAKNDGARIEVQ
ncbi:MAG: beta-ribofuranosylaminobenzene 5'-phosphate synthase family protein [Planctomycetaceae bacterium]